MEILKLNLFDKVIDATEKIALLADGTVWYIDSSNCTKINGLTNIVKIASDDNSYVALDADGNVYNWGKNYYGMFGNGTTSENWTPVKSSIKDIVDIKASNSTILLLDKDGNVYGAGYNGYGQLGNGTSSNTNTTYTKVENVQNIKNIALESYSSAISDKSGFVYTSGYNGQGELGNGDTTTRNKYEVIGETYVDVGDPRVTVETGKTKQVTATLNNKFNLITDVIDTKNITYTSLDDSIATVNESGIITAKEVGKVEIIAKHTITGKTSTIFVNVVPTNKQAVPDIKISSTHMASLKADGTVWTWGDNTYGQLGTEDNIIKTIPTKVTALENVIAITTGEYDTVALKNDGTVWAFGNNSYGQLGNGNSNSSNVPVQVIKQNGKPLTNIVKIASKDYRTIALDGEGKVWIWGQNYGSTARKLDNIYDVIDISANYAVKQDGTVQNIRTLEQLKLENILRVSEGTNHTVFLTRDGKGYSLGTNTKGQLGNGTKTNSDVPTQILSTDGESELTGIKQLTAGNEFTMALLDDNKTYVWGTNDNYKLANSQETNQVIPVVNENIQDAMVLTAGINNGAIINKEGFVYAWGNGANGILGNKLFNNTKTPSIVGKEDLGLEDYNVSLNEEEQYTIKVTNETFNVLRNVENTDPISFTSKNNDIATVSDKGVVTANKAGTTSIVVNKTGTTENRILQLTVLPKDVKIEPMALTEGSHTTVLKADGTVWAYGLNSSYQLGNGTSVSSDIPVQVKFPEGIVIKQIAVGNTHNLALDTDGNVWGWGANSNYALGFTSSTPRRLGLSNIKKIAARNDQSMCLTKDGYVYVWGLNSNGQLGTRTYEVVRTPTMIPYISDIIDISMGEGHTLLLTTDGKVLASGLNTYGQTGKANGKSNTFEKIDLDELVCQIAAGTNHSELLTVDGEIYSMGYNGNGQLGLGNKENVTIPTKVTGLTNVSRITAGKNYTMALDYNQKVYSAGSNSNGELGIGSDEEQTKFANVSSLENVMEIDAGETYSVAIKYDGNVYGWGNYYHGLQNIKTRTNSRIPVTIGNETSYAKQQEIIVNVNSTKQAEITPKYTFNVFKDDETKEKYTYETLNENIATVDEKGVITGKQIGTTWVKATETETNKTIVFVVKVIGQDHKNAVSITAGDKYAAVLKADGSIWSFGYNSDGQLGNDKLVPTNVPNKTNIISSYTKLVAGKKFTVAIRNDGTVWAWGDNTYGVLGQGNRTSAKKPIQVQGLSNVVDIAAGENHVVALDSMGKVYTWGLNTSGQLGNENVQTETKPKEINGLGSEIVSISAGANMTALVDSNGYVYMFGDNSNELISKFEYNTDKYGQNILPANNQYYSSPVKVNNVNNAVKVAIMKNEIAILQSDGNIELITKNAINDTKNSSNILSNVVDIKSQNESLIAIDKDLNAYTYGNNTKGQSGNGTTSSKVQITKVNTEGKQYIAASAGYEDNYLIDTQGFVYASGDNQYGQLGNGTNISSSTFTLVGDKKFKIVPEARTMAQPETEKVSIESNGFNVFGNTQNTNDNYEWSSSNNDVATVENGVISSLDMGETTITAVDKLTGEKATALRVVQPLDEQRLDTITVNGEIATLVGENKYKASIVPNKDGTATVQIKTKDSTDKISIDSGANYSTATLSKDVTLDSDPKEVKIKVLTTNGKEVNYLLTIDTISSDCGIDKISVNGVQAKATSDTEFEIIVANDVVKPQVTAVAKEETSKVSIDSQAAELKEAARTIDMTTSIKKVIPIQITAENGDNVSYTLVIYKEDALTEMDNIKVNDIEATKLNRNTYKVASKNIGDSATVTAKSLYPSADIKINNEEAEVNVTTKVVSTLEDETIVKVYITAKENEREYTLIIEKISEDETPEDKEEKERQFGIFSLEVDGKLASQSGTTYTAYIDQDANKADISIITKQNSDIISMNDETAVNKMNKTIEITEDKTTIKIQTTNGEKKEEQKEYVLNIIRGEKPATKDGKLGLFGLTVNGNVVNAIGNEYTAYISNNTESVDVMAVTFRDDDKVQIGDNETKVHTTTATVATTNEENTVKIIVTDGNDEAKTKEYTLHINKPSSDASLKSITVGNEEFSKIANRIPGTNNFEVSVSNIYENLDITAVANYDQSSVAIGYNSYETGLSTQTVNVAENNTINILVKAQNDKVETYKLIINKENSDTKLTKVTVDGNEATLSKTEENTYEYTLDKVATKVNVGAITNDKNASVSINTKTEEKNTQYTDISIDGKTATAYINVTAEDGSKKQYKLIINSLPDDIRIQKVKINDVEAEAVPTNTYKAKVNKEDKNFEVYVITVDPKAKIQIENNEETTGSANAIIARDSDETIVNVKVTAQDGTTENYKINVSNKSDDASLEEIKVNGVTIEPNAEGVYKAKIKHLMNKVSISATAANQQAKVSIEDNEQTTGSQIATVDVPDTTNTKNVKITAEDGTEKVSEVVIEKLSNNTNMTMTVTTDGNEKEASFDENGLATIKVGNAEKATLKGVLEDKNATISIGGNIATAEQNEATLDLTEEVTNVETVVTAVDGTQKQYTVRLVRNSSDNELKTLETNKGEVLKTSENSYTIGVPDTLNSIELTAIANNENAKVKISDASFGETNKSTSSIAINNDTQDITITVKAENGDEKNYTVTIKKVTDLGIKQILANDEKLVEENNSYALYIDANTENVNLKITPNNSKAIMTTKVGDEKASDEKSVSTCELNIDTSSNKEQTVVITLKDPVNTSRIKSYSVIIKEKSHDASLELLQVDGKNAMTTEYGYKATTSTSATTSSIYAKATNEFAKVSIVGIADGNNELSKNVTLSSQKATTLKILVTAQDGVTSNEYTLTIVKQSNDTSLSIKVNDATTDEYDPSTNTYTKYIERNVETATVAVTTTNEDASVEIAGDKALNTLSKQFSINGETTTADITVTAENGDIKVYHLNICKKSTDTSIEQVRVNNVVINEVDGKYTALVKDRKQDVQNVSIYVKANNKKAKIQIGDGSEWQEGISTSDVSFKDSNRTIILALNVEAQDSGTQIAKKELEIKLVSDDVSIKSVKVQEESAEYDSSTNTYSYYVDKSVEKVTFAIEANNPYTTLEADGNKSVGAITIGNVDVTSEDTVYTGFTAISESGEQKQTYKIAIYKKSNNANASHIYVDGKDAIEQFENINDVPTCTYLIANAKDSTNINVTTENKYASIQIGDSSKALGNLAQNVSLNTDENSITVPVIITSQDGKVVKTYNIIFVRMSNNTNISWLEVDGKHIIQNDEGNYEAIVRTKAKSAKVKIDLEDENSKVTIGGLESYKTLTETVALTDSSSTVKTITVTAQDGTTRDCKLILKRQENNLGLDKVYLNGRAATKVDDTTFKIDVKKGTTKADIKAVASNSKEYVQISDNEKTIAENKYENCTLTDNKIAINVIAMYADTTEIDAQKEYTLVVNEIEDTDTLEDLKIKVKVNDQTVELNDSGEYEITFEKPMDNVSVYAETSSETSKVKVKDDNGESVFGSPSIQRNVGIASEITVAKIIVENGSGEQKEYKLTIKGIPLFTIKGKVLTEAKDQTNQSATIKLQKVTTDSDSDTENNPEEYTINNDGTFEVKTIKGTYNLIIEKDGYLKYTITDIIVENKNITLGDLKIYAGDVVKDDEIEIDDLTDLNDNIGVVITDENKSEKSIYDLNEDGTIDKLDRNILKKNYGKKSKTVKWVNPEVGLIKPITTDYVITSKYGMRKNPVTGETKLHSGIDIVGEHHTPIIAVANGEVTYAGVQNGYGNCVEIKHTVNGNTIYSFYAHLSRIDVNVGDTVTQGQTIGLEGGASTDENHGTSTGHHLHFEIRTASGSGHSVDPSTYIEF